MPSPTRILVVEDEPIVAEVVERYLKRDGHEVAVVHDGREAIAAFERFAPSLIVLDLMLPGLDGIEICRRIRERSHTPIIMLTARGDEVDKLQGLDVGADDYVTKPFSPRELAARVQAVLRRAGPQPTLATGGEQVLRFDDLLIDLPKRIGESAQGSLDLTAREFDLLSFLARHPGQVFTRDQLLDAVWDRAFTGEPGTVTVHMRRLRSKVEADASRPRHLKTVWGVGYKFES
ncbi:MAG: response regulator transcription factor [Chloroflexi bacterium]|nr:response regulator transcription factor [Chloroflexota bacterium]MDA1003668.1 response regulator transcription factor [Chloroflexota bacterium]